MKRLSQYRADILFWVGFVLITAGIYGWLGAAGALIFTGIWLSGLGILTDLVQGKKQETKK
jgi:hypothetical protein